MPAPHFSVFGFPVRVSGSALIIGAIFAYLSGIQGLYYIGILFCSILLHELGHAFTFRKYGYGSFITLHMFGGSTTPFGGQGLSDRQHITVSLAGPMAQICLVGLPSVGLFLFGQTYGDVGIYYDLRSYFQISILVNIALPLFNLLPIYPLDGGQILLHVLRLRGSANPLRTTMLVTRVIGVLAAGGMWWAGYRVGAFMIGYLLYQSWDTERRTSRSPNRIQLAASQAHAEHNHAGRQKSNKNVLLQEAYERLLDGNTRRLEVVIEHLVAERATNEVETLRQWQSVLDGEARSPEVPPSSLLTSTTLVVASNSAAGTGISDLLTNGLESPELPAAIALLLRHGRLSEAVAEVSDDALSEIRELLVRRGLPKEQMAVSRIMRLRSEAGQV